MSLDTQRAALQTRHAAIAGIKKAPATYPDRINSDTDLPIVLMWPDEGDWWLPAVKHERQDRRWRVQVLVRPVSQGISLNNVMTTLYGLIQAFGTGYVRTPRVSSTIVIATDRGSVVDSGPAVIQFNGTDYHGFEFLVALYERQTPA